MAVARISVGINTGNFVPYSGANQTLDINTQSFSAGFVRAYGNIGGQVAVAMAVQNINSGGVSQLAFLNESGSIFGEILQTNSTTNYVGSNAYLINNSTYLRTNGTELGMVNYATSGLIKMFLNISGTVTEIVRVNSTGLLLTAKNISTDTTTGMKIATATNQKLGFFNAAPIIQPTTSITAGTLVSVGGTPISSNDTFGGYTLGQMAAILRNLGLAA